MGEERMREKVLSRVKASGLYSLTRLYEEVAEECGVEWTAVRSVVRQLKRQGLVETYRGAKHWWVTLPEQTQSCSEPPRLSGAGLGHEGFTPGMDLKAIESKEERDEAYKAFNALRGRKGSPWTLVDGRIVEKAWEEPDWDGARAWIEAHDKVTNSNITGLWRKFGVHTEWVREELKDRGFFPQRQGYTTIGYCRDSARKYTEDLDQLRKLARHLRAEGYDCAQVQTMLEEVWE